MKQLQHFGQMAASIPVWKPWLERILGNLRGILWMLTATASFAGMQSTIRYISQEIHPFEVAFCSNLTGVVVLLPWVIWRGWGVLRTDRLHLHGLRALINVTAMLIFFSGLSLTPVAEAAALNFSAPLFGSLGAIWLLGEAFDPRSWVTMACGILGMLLILRPGFEAISLGPILVLVGSMVWAGVLITVKLLSRTDSSLAITTYMALFLTPLSLLPALWVWRTPSLEQGLWLGLVGVLMVGGQLFMTEAFRAADITTVLPLDFTKLIWASLIGYWAFAEVPDLWTWVGGGVIFSSSTYLALSRARSQAPIKASTLDPVP